MRCNFSRPVFILHLHHKLENNEHDISTIKFYEIIYIYKYTYMVCFIKILSHDHTCKRNIKHNC